MENLTRVKGNQESLAGMKVKKGDWQIARKIKNPIPRANKGNELQK